MPDLDPLPLTAGESRLLEAIVDAWPDGVTDVALDANAIWVGKQIGMTEAQVVAAVHSLASKHLLHVRDLNGVLMVHPTPKALEQSARRGGLVLRLIRWLRGSRAEGR